ncbi:MAG TPA: glycerophosphodiester phosphodiesterase [Acidimicrobiales bacterium]|nr:glycerophosphodiester phosphodiesterase [Acidimicrobiales bacterium]
MREPTWRGQPVRVHPAQGRPPCARPHSRRGAGPTVEGIDALRRPPIAFAHRGARAHAPENTVEAFRLALKLGATGLESDVWLTADGVPALDHDGVVRASLWRRPIGEVPRAELPAHIPSLAELFEACGVDFELSLDVKDPAAAPAVVAVSRQAGLPLRRLWLCGEDWEVVAGWRSLADDVRLVDSCRLRRMREGPERRAADLAAARIDAVNMHASDWTLGLTTLFHRFELYAFAWDAQHDRVLDAVLAMGVDAVYSDHVDRMVDALQKVE